MSAKRPITKKDLRDQEKLVEKILKTKDESYNQWLFDIQQDFINEFLLKNTDVLTDAIDKKQNKQNNF